jgi:hypothetical protein
MLVTLVIKVPKAVVNVRRSSCKVTSVSILKKNNFSGQVLERFPNVTFHKTS